MVLRVLMTCYWPLRSFEGPVKEKGKVNIVWKRSESERAVELMLPCGQCIGCRLERSRQWAVRCLYESSLWKDNCFITLTYDDEHLPLDGSLHVSEFQCFMKRLRKQFGSGIRFFHCGEYGETCKVCRLSKQYCSCSVFVAGIGRPHFHALLFNFDFSDRDLMFERNGNKIFRSSALEKLWPKGYSSVADVTFESAGYVARYSMKKVTGDKAKDHYGGLKPEYVTMSRRPGIGRGWYDKFKSDVFPSDFMVVNGVKMKPPRFFDNLLDKEDSVLFNCLKLDRKKKGSRLVPMKVGGRVILVNDNDSFRLPVKEAVKKACIQLLKRPLAEV